MKTVDEKEGDGAMTNQIVQVDGNVLETQLDRLVSGKVEEILNAMPDAPDRRDHGRREVRAQQRSESVLGITHGTDADDAITPESRHEIDLDDAIMPESRHKVDLDDAIMVESRHQRGLRRRNCLSRHVQKNVRISQLSVQTDTQFSAYQSKAHTSLLNHPSVTPQQ